MSDQAPEISPPAAAPVPEDTSSVVPPANGRPSRRTFLQRTAVLAAAGSSAALLLQGGTRLLRADDRRDSGNRDQDRGDNDNPCNESDFVSIRQHENAHVAFLVNALGAQARPKPTFKNLEQRTFRDFVDVSQALENTGVGAYLGAAPIINSAAYLAAAGSIGFIEARHAGFLNVLVGSPITANILDLNSDNNFEVPLTIDQVVASAGPFIASLNGGPPLTFSTTSSDANDIAILNFALALEYLEADYYNINVPKFFRKGHR